MNKVTAEFGGGYDLLQIFLIQYVVSPEGEGPIFSLEADIEVDRIVGFSLSFTVVASTKRNDSVWRNARARRCLRRIAEYETEPLVSG